MSDTPSYVGDPSTNSSEFRRCLGQFATGVTVVTAQADGVFIGMTVNSFASVSLDPPLILWSVDRASARYAQFAKVDRFVINVLSDNQISLSRHFASSGPNKFRDIGWASGESGLPVLNDTSAFFECSRESAYECGDHLILIGRVNRAASFDRGVLLFSQGRYRIPADHPSDSLRPSSSDIKLPTSEGSRILLNLFRANHKLAFEFSRFREGMTRDQHRVIVAIERNPGIDADAIARAAFLGSQVTDDAIHALLADGAICRHPDGKIELTLRGRQQRHALDQKQVEMEKDLLKDLPESVVAAGVRLLAHLADS